MSVVFQCYPIATINADVPVILFIVKEKGESDKGMRKTCWKVESLEEEL
ncbi:MAG TPA: hypothetical protein VK796_00695 [Cytophaga sp.]|nr:hypothetical protein [Cytophaga sp.]